MEETDVKTLLLLLDTRHRVEIRTKRPLAHDGGKMLLWIINRMSIPREAWIHDYCITDEKQLPKKKKERTVAVKADILRIREQIKRNSPCVVVGMGKLPCEILTGASLVGTKAGTWWEDTATGFERVWITYAPDAALFDPPLFVDITAVLARAAKEANIPIKNRDIGATFDWAEYARL